MKYRLVLILFAVSLVLIHGCAYSPSTHNEIAIHYADSVFQNFYVENEVVHIICKITIENNSTSDAEVLLNAISDEDVGNGLLKKPEMCGIDTETGIPILTVKAGQLQEFIIDFLGEFGGNNQKYDHMIPDVLEIVMVK